ncbi:MAG: hypothetical protein WCI51_20920, partial [Lentisphaerota bacterium]
MFQSYQMLRFTETDLRNEHTLNRHGRLVYSSNWYPKKYSTCGLFTAENIHLALAYFQCGLKENGLEILDAITDAYFMGKNPGMAAHVLSAHGVSDGGDLDFSDVSSMYLRLIVEGLYGIRFHLVDGVIEIAPGFPSSWTQADINLKDIELNYHREGCQENITVHCEKNACKRIKLPMRSTVIENVLLNDAPVDYTLEAAVNNCYLIVETAITGVIKLQITHGKNTVPTIECPAVVFTSDELAVKISKGEIIVCRDTSGSLEKIYLSHRRLSAKVKAESGSHTVFIRVKDEQYEAWLAADFMVENKAVQERLITVGKSAADKFEPLDIAPYFNCSLTAIHTLEYRIPRPAGYSIGMRLNGRYAWDWNQSGHNAVQVDDTALRLGKGMFYSPSGIGFATPADGLNVACASIWDNFPTVLEIQLTGQAAELALFFIGVTNPMQSRVENARFTVTYADGLTQSISLVNPESFDDWLNAALQTQNETVYFSDYNHGMVQRINLDPQKELSKISIEAIANEVIIGLMGISIRK